MNQKQSKKHPDPTNRQWLEVGFRQLIHYKKAILFFVVILIAIAIITFTLTTGETSKAETNYLIAANSYTLLQSSLRGDPNPMVRVDTLETLKTMTNAYPELQSKYDGFIAQMLLIQDKAEEAAVFVDRTLKRTAKDHLPLYTDFTRTTIAIAEENYEEALNQAKRLKEKMVEQIADSSPGRKQKDFGDLLFAYNLFRIAMLEQKAGNREQEQEAWKEWKTYAQSNRQESASKRIHSKAFLQLSQQIGEGEFTLIDYINEREQK